MIGANVSIIQRFHCIPLTTSLSFSLSDDESEEELPEELPLSDELLVSIVIPPGPPEELGGPEPPGLGKRA